MDSSVQNYNSTENMKKKKKKKTEKKWNKNDFKNQDLGL